MKVLFTLVMAVVLFASCKKEVADVEVTSSPASELQAIALPSLTPIVEHDAEPQQTDAAITTQTVGDPLQYAYLPQNAGQRKDVLFVFIPGTFSTPSQYNNVCEAAAQSGYYSFGVAYSNLSPVEFYEGLNPTDSTVEDILEEFLTGNNVSPRVTVTRANSFENRIIKMVSYLDSLYPTENWKRFLTADKQIRWDKVSVAGHSQGSDHAMYMSKARGLYRAGFIGGPGSFLLKNGNYPSFMQVPGLTPYSKLYGFNHIKDPVRKWSDVKVTWQVLGLPGAPNSVDDKTVNGSHQLTTDLNLSDAHSGTIQDDVTPKDKNGNPLYAPVWQYMNFPK